MPRSTANLAPRVINDEAWLKGEFIPTVQQRGAAIIKARGFIQRRQRRKRRRGQRPFHHRTDAGWRLAQRLCLLGRRVMALRKVLISSFPVRSNGQKLEIVQDVPINEFSRAKIDATVNELKEERGIIGDLLPK